MADTPVPPPKPVRLKKDGTPYAKLGRKPNPPVLAKDLEALNAAMVPKYGDVIDRTNRDAVLKKTPSIKQLQTDAEFTDIALRVLAGQTPLEIATIRGVKVQYIRTRLRDPRLQAVYLRERDKHAADVSGALRDEKLPTVIRKRALVTRGQTVIGEVLDQVRTHIAEHSGNVKAAILKAGIEAANVAFNHEGMERNAGGSSPDANFKIQADKAIVINQMVAEADIDISDLFTPPDTDDPLGDGDTSPAVIDVTPEPANDNDAPS